jgi:hypothetical protein
MTDLPPQADIRRLTERVRFGPKGYNEQRACQGSPASRRVIS